MNKTKMLVALAFVLVFILAVPVMGQASGDIRVTVDGVQVHFAQKNPVIVEDRTLVHVRGVFEHLGFAVNWDGATRQVILTNPNYHIIVTIGSNSFTTNAITHSLPVPAQIIDDFTMLPIAPLMQSMGFNVSWDGSARTVVIVSPEVPPVQQPPPVEDPQPEEPEYEEPQNEEPQEEAPVEEDEEEEYPEEEDEEKEHPEYVTIRGIRIPTNQVVLYLESMWLTDEDVAPLRYMTHLRELRLGDNDIRDLSFLEGIETLQMLWLNNNHNIGDISPLAELPNLWFLDLSNNPSIWNWEYVRHISDVVGDVWW